MTRIAMIAGATGLIGSQLLPRLLADRRYDRVIAIGRRAPPLQHPKLQVVIDDLAAVGPIQALGKVDDVFCALGSTIAQAGSRQAFTHVDHDLVLNLAKAHKAAGGQQLLVVSAVGADSRSASFYSRTKGQMEDSLKSLQLRSLHLFQPSLLIGHRNERRFAEQLAQRAAPLISSLLQGGWTRYRPVEATVVAEALHAAAARDEIGLHVHRAPFDLSFASKS